MSEHPTLPPLTVGTRHQCPICDAVSVEEFSKVEAWSIGFSLAIVALAASQGGERLTFCRDHYDSVTCALVYSGITNFDSFIRVNAGEDRSPS